LSGFFFILIRDTCYLIPASNSIIIVFYILKQLFLKPEIPDNNKGISRKIIIQGAAGRLAGCGEIFGAGQKYYRQAFPRAYWTGS
jgi:hypothetical protein